jgi:hypothetical protein
VPREPTPSAIAGGGFTAREKAAARAASLVAARARLGCRAACRLFAALPEIAEVLLRPEEDALAACAESEGVFDNRRVAEVILRDPWNSDAVRGLLERRPRLVTMAAGTPRADEFVRYVAGAGAIAGGTDGRAVEATLEALRRAKEVGMFAGKSGAALFREFVAYSQLPAARWFFAAFPERLTFAAVREELFAPSSQYMGGNFKEGVAPLLALLFPWGGAQLDYFLKETLDTFHVALFREVGACEKSDCGYNIGDLVNFWIAPRRWPVLRAYMAEVAGPAVSNPWESLSGERKPDVSPDLARSFDDLAWLADAYARVWGEAALLAVFAADRPPPGGRSQVEPFLLLRAYRAARLRIPFEKRPGSRVGGEFSFAGPLTASESLS